VLIGLTRKDRGMKSTRKIILGYETKLDLPGASNGINASPISDVTLGASTCAN
jgi:hypothetical protein